ncbi:MAG: sigma-70 family RNA polymerase sigma factor [Deltaproteobacteria bacterium]|nr:sigma-70 family RNA polymerase sigma factor [Deltaproteobacteria bacterium]
MKYSNTKTGSVALRAPTSSHMKYDDIIGSIYEQYNAGLRKYLKRHLNSKEDVDDISQEVYLRIIKLCERNEIKPSLSLLCTIASNILIDRFRSQRLRQAQAHISTDEVQLKSPLPSPEEMLRSKEWVSELMDVLNSLGKDCRHAFILHRFKGLTYGEIAKKMGISKGMVSKHISYVLLKLDKKLRKYI